MTRTFAPRSYFVLCLALGRLLRSTKYSKVRFVCEEGRPTVRKHRAFYAPLLVWLGDPLMRILNTGVRVLPQAQWQERETLVHRRLRRTPVRTDTDGALVLPRLPGRTLADLLEDADLEASVRTIAIARAAVALAEFHRLGFTHGDAMAENVLVDLECRTARWFDFETMHDTTRQVSWRRADDVRGLLVTCLLRTPVERRGETLDLVLDAYGDPGVAGHLTASFSSVWRRPLTFHLAQAPLSFTCFQEIGRLLAARLFAHPRAATR